MTQSNGGDYNCDRTNLAHRSCTRSQSGLVEDFRLLSAEPAIEHVEVRLVVEPERPVIEVLTLAWYIVGWYS
jgi:hypothetical protein